MMCMFHIKNVAYTLEHIKLYMANIVAIEWCIRNIAVVIQLLLHVPEII